jgi:hypothetical protein
MQYFAAVVMQRDFQAIDPESRVEFWWDFFKSLMLLVIILKWFCGREISFIRDGKQAGISEYGRTPDSFGMFSRPWLCELPEKHSQFSCDFCPSLRLNLATLCRS